jgi:opacity protein-like surface antigen
MKRSLFATVLVPAALAAAGAAHAQSAAPAADNSKIHGFMVGVHLNGSAIQPDGGDTESGGGLGLRLGYGVSNHVTLYAEGDGASVDYANTPGSYTLAHVGLGVRGTFRGARAKLRPFVEGALMGVGAADTEDGSDVLISGGGLQVGGGLEYFFSRHVALDMGLTFGPGSFNKATVDGETSDIDKLNFTSSRFNLGVSFHP